MGVKVIIGGDLFVSKTYASTNIFSPEIVDLFAQSDINVINLECPVIDQDNNEKIIKTGPHLFTGDDTFQLLKRINIHVVTLANNHILDYGAKGLKSTLQGCLKNNILPTGAGDNIGSASEPVIIERQGIKLAFINFCEHEFSIATDHSPGANPLDIIDRIKDIKNARQLADFVFVIIHGGHEHYHLPSPRMVKQYRYFAECGADAIICHHSHCISGFEAYNEVPIFYGLGNLLFTMPCDFDGWYNGLLIQFEIKKGASLKWKLIPTQQTKDTYLLSLSSEKEKNTITEKINQYSRIISDSKALQKEWIKFAKSMESQILNEFSPVNIIPGAYLRALLRKSGINKIIFRKNYVVPILNQIECESLHDLSQYVLNSKKR